MNKLFVAVVAVGSMMAVPSAFAAGGMLKACKGELKKFGCKAKTEADAHECLEQHEAHGKKDDGFKHACYEAHESYEKKMGKEEKGEEHHDEKGEHKE
ncbi:MAG: hypothetical protein HY074_15955 [Deltaproteobacteria bacterium]|nr:hypothetical protein [Deltaproteobacteria bacterium]